jgi:hypothetical protein
LACRRARICGGRHGDFGEFTPASIGSGRQFRKGKTLNGWKFPVLLAVQRVATILLQTPP